MRENNTSNNWMHTCCKTLFHWNAPLVQGMEFHVTVVLFVKAEMIFPLFAKRSELQREGKYRTETFSLEDQNLAMQIQAC